MPLLGLFVFKISQDCSLENSGDGRRIIYMSVCVSYIFNAYPVPGLPGGLVGVRLPSSLTALKIVGVSAHPHGLHTYLREFPEAHSLSPFLSLCH